MKRWRCRGCNYVTRGDEAPEKCPRCGAPREAFVEIPEDGYEDTSRLGGFNGRADVIVVGSGAAAFSTAISVLNQGGSVIMLEKENTVGGTTARSGGGMWVPLNKWQKEGGYEDNEEDALKYMAKYSYPHIYNPNDDQLGVPKREFELLKAYVDNAHNMISLYDEIGALHTGVVNNWTGKFDPDYADSIPENKGIRGRCVSPRNKKDRVIPSGYELIKQVEAWTKSKGIKIFTKMEVDSILQDETGRVTGVTATKDGDKFTFNANLAVVFGTGGYTHNEEYMLQFQRGPHFGGCSVPTNTGDFIKLGGQVGARIGNTAGAFRSQNLIEKSVDYPGSLTNLFYLIGDSMILVNKYGKRIVDEKRDYNDRTMIHFVWDPIKIEWTNMLTFLIFDERTAKGWEGLPMSPLGGGFEDYVIKGETLEELEKEFSKHLEKLSSRVGNFSLDSNFGSNLKDTIVRFNNFATTGVDEDFHRGEMAYDREWTTFPPNEGVIDWDYENSKNYTMYPIAKDGPYYGVILSAGTLDTNGGPVINKNAQVLDWHDRPIPGLYGAGNCISSPAANAYWGGGGTLGPATTFGYIAGRHIMGK